MSFHFKLKDLFDGCVVRSIKKNEEGGGGSGGDGDDGLPQSLSSDDDKEVFLKTLLHNADLSNPAKPWYVSRHWSDRVADEFFNQGDREKREGLPISPNMDRDTTDRAELALNFGDFIVAPAYVALASLLPKAKECVVCIVENRARWEEIHNQRLSSCNMEEEKKKEELAKWNKRRVAFEKIVGAEILAGVESGPASTSSSTLGKTSRDRRKSLRVLQEFVAASAADDEEDEEAQKQPQPASAGRVVAELSGEGEEGEDNIGLMIEVETIPLRSSSQVVEK